MRPTKSLEEFTVAGRSIRPILMGIGLAAASASGWAYIGAPGVAYAYGLIELLSTPLAWIPGIFAVAFLAIPIYRRLSELFACKSVPEFIGNAHGKAFGLICLVAVIMSIQYLMFLTAQFKAAGLVLGSLLGISFNQAVIIAFMVLTIYAVLGGLRGALYTDIIQAGFMIFVCLSSLYLIYLLIGGPTKLLEEAAKLNPNYVFPSTGEPYAKSYALLWFLIYVAYMGFQFQPSFVQFYMSVRKPSYKDSALIATIAGLITLLTTYQVMGGLLGKVVLKPLEDPDKVMPVLWTTYLHPMITSLLLIGAWSAILSSQDAYLVATIAGMTTVLEHAFIKFKIAVSEKGKLLIARSIGLLIAITSMTWAITSPPPLLAILAIIGTTGLAAVLTGPLFVRLWWEGTKIGAYVSLLVTWPFYLICAYYEVLGWLELAVVGMIISGVLYISISLLDKRLRQK